MFGSCHSNCLFKQHMPGTCGNFWIEIRAVRDGRSTWANISLRTAFGPLNFNFLTVHIRPTQDKGNLNIRLLLFSSSCFCCPQVAKEEVFCNCNFCVVMLGICIKHALISNMQAEASLRSPRLDTTQTNKLSVQWLYAPTPLPRIKKRGCACHIDLFGEYR